MIIACKRVVTSSMYLEYRIQPPSIIGLPWDSSVQYEIGSQVYFDTGSGTGNLQPKEGTKFSANFYTCNVSNKNVSPSNPF